MTLALSSVSRQSGFSHVARSQAGTTPLQSWCARFRTKLCCEVGQTTKGSRGVIATQQVRNNTTSERRSKHGDPRKPLLSRPVEQGDSSGLGPLHAITSNRGLTADSRNESGHIKSPPQHGTEHYINPFSGQEHYVSCVVEETNHGRTGRLPEVHIGKPVYKRLSSYITESDGGYKLISATVNTTSSMKMRSGSNESVYKSSMDWSLQPTCGQVQGPSGSSETENNRAQAWETSAPERRGPLRAKTEPSKARGATRLPQMGMDSSLLKARLFTEHDNTVSDIQRDSTRHAVPIELSPGVRVISTTRVSSHIIGNRIGR